MGERARPRHWVRGIVLVVTSAVISLGAVTAATTPAGAVVPIVVVGDASVHEGDSGTRNVRIMISLDQPAAATVKVSWVAVAGTATSPADFKARTGAVGFRPGQTTKYATVKIFPDVSTEGDQSFSVNVTAALGATVGDGSGQVTIVDEEGGTGNVLSIGSASVAEGNPGAYQFAYVPVTLRSPSATPVTVVYTTSPGTATSPEDYLDRTKTLNFPVGVRVRWALVYVYSDAVAAEGDHLLDITLSSPTAATIGEDTGSVTILDED